ncbi:UDP-2,3-diacylglucosamine diphosphatase [Ideonella margarita]|uniref:UDP-2,3-diacylglucosamine hydrolase n=1 Tax=Ideonella margarita TaxID=2984191 RepID=A0ABU9C4I6_9BURK
MPDQAPTDGAATLLRLPAGMQRLEFISDLHLSPELPRTCAAFFAWLEQSDADALFILGDLFEVWVGDDMLSQAFEQECAARMAQAARRRPLHVMHGNRDFLLGDAFMAATGCVSLNDPTLLVSDFGKVLLTHGDALCTDDTAYQAFRAQVRTPAWQTAWLARPLPERLMIAAQMRAASQEHQQGQAPADWADVNPVLAQAWLAKAQCTTLLHGHTHRPCHEHRPEGWERLVLSDWDLDQAHSVAPRGDVLSWSAGGWQRRPCTAPG